MEIKVTYTEKVGDVSRVVEISIPVKAQGATSVGLPEQALSPSAFNTSELAEESALAKLSASLEESFKPMNKALEEVHAAISPDEAFGPKSAVAPSTADAGASTTVQEDTTETISTPPPSVPAPPAPTPVSETATVAQVPSPPAVGVELDVNGLPWDSRIHSGARTKLVTGEWKLLRGVDKNLVEAVNAELRNVMALTSTSAPPPPTVSAPPPAQVAPPPPATAMTFADLLLQVTARHNAGQLDTETVLKACQKSGLPNLPSLAQRLDFIEDVARELGILQ